MPNTKIQKSKKRADWQIHRKGLSSQNCATFFRELQFSKRLHLITFDMFGYEAENTLVGVWALCIFKQDAR